ncbi:MAG: hypothetical protein E7774_00890 [Bradyrhizobium sp.]|nr:MAG: hypothetical protein E7774_00890 [Bradyrhizobium sp.]
MDVKELELQLDDFDRARRQEALAMLWQAALRGEITLPARSGSVNLHAHTFFSYNAYGYSPSKFAWLARKAGLLAAGIVDFDVLDGVDEFLEAGELIGLRTCASIESRVYVPEFATLVINSPGEPGVAYHMGVGFPRATTHPFLSKMRSAAQTRTRGMIKRVNRFLDPVRIDFDRDVAPLSPNGNVTERHLCEAYERQAIAVFADPARRAKFWKERLGDAPDDSAKLRALIRAKTMKKGGVGYVAPDKGSFPEIAQMNRFVIEAGAIPTIAWLDGLSDGERRMDEYIDTAMASGAAALNVIPDCNYTPGSPSDKAKNLHGVVSLAERRGFPVVAGTEMNTYGQKFVDSFDSTDLKPLAPTFARSAYIVYAHTVLRRELGVGYLGQWAEANFTSVATKNDFFFAVGRALQPGKDMLVGADADASPRQLLNMLG